MPINNTDYKLGDIYPGYSISNTRDKSIPDSADLEVTSGSEQNQKAEQIAQVTTTNTNKGGIWTGVIVIAVIVIILGIFR